MDACAKGIEVGYQKLYSLSLYVADSKIYNSTIKIWKQGNNAHAA